MVAMTRGTTAMKKILIYSLLCCVVIGSGGIFADTTEDDAKPIEPETIPQLKLFHINYLIDTVNIAFPILFQSPQIKLDKEERIKLLKPASLDLSIRPKRRWGRTLLQSLAHFAYATTSYWVRLEVMKEDWEYLFTWEDQKKRFLFEDGFRFDSNTFSFNWTHSLAGAIYYNYARSNHFNPGASFAITLASSYFWEFVVEFREVVSINDMIATPIGGVSIGESLFQLGRHFRNQKPTFINKIARFVSNPILSVSDWLDRKKGKNQYAYTDNVLSDLQFYIGPGYDSFISSENNTYVKLGFNSHLNLIPEYGEPGVSNRYVNQTMATRFDIGGTFGSKGMYQFNIFAKATFMGYLMQNIQNSGDDRVGYSFFIGASSAFDYMQQIPENIAVPNDSSFDSEQMEYLADKYTIINLFGPSLDLTLFQEDFSFQLSADAYADFSLIHSHAFKRFSDFNSYRQTKSTLDEHGYYYALGYTLSSMMKLDIANLQLKGKVNYHYFNSIEGMDRFQPELDEKEDFDLKDYRFNYDISLGYQLPNTNVQLVVGLQRINRKGYVENFMQEHTEKRSYFQIRYLF
jgi:hypothetical protein